MIMRRLILLLFAALLLCAVGCHIDNQSGWGRTPQTAVPVDASTMASLPSPVSDSQPSTAPPPSNPITLCDANGEVQFTFQDDPSEPPTRWTHFHDDMTGLWPAIKQDYRNYYSWDNFKMLGAAFGVAAMVANSQTDRELREEYQEHVRGPEGNHFAVWCKDFGDGALMIPVMAAGWVGGEMMSDWPAGSVVGEWGERSMRSLFVGTPPMLLAQWVIGAARPGETDDNSAWRPFRHSNGVSGHAFIGGIMFIDAAKMADNCWLKTGFYALSLLPAWSRINDDAHFPSQAFLGWWMAYCAATAVDDTQRNQSSWKVMPLPVDDGVGMGLMYQY